MKGWRRGFTLRRQGRADSNLDAGSRLVADIASRRRIDAQVDANVAWCCMSMSAIGLPTIGHFANSDTKSPGIGGEHIRESRDM
jgi:hypothetical protein